MVIHHSYNDDLNFTVVQPVTVSSPVRGGGGGGRPGRGCLCTDNRKKISLLSQSDKSEADCIKLAFAPHHLENMTDYSIREKVRCHISFSSLRQTSGALNTQQPQQVKHRSVYLDGYLVI